MAESLPDLIEQILRECAATTPNLWFPSRSALSHVVTLQQLQRLGEQLGEAGFLTTVRDPHTHEKGFQPTPSALRLLEDPQALARLRQDLGEATPVLPLQEEELPSDSPEQQRMVHKTLRAPVRSRVWPVLLGINLVVFALEMYLSAQGQGVTFGELTPGALNRVGLLSFPALIRGEQWRLLACCFVHLSLIHIAMNMYALYILGRDMEWLWGPVRFLIIYLLAGLGGSVAAMLLHPDHPVAGASGALCGLMAGEAVWLILNRRYLPKQLASRQLRNIAINAFLIAMISIIPIVSGAGHLGGAVVGAVAACLLHYQRFAPSLFLRGSAALLLLALPVLCWLPLQARVHAHIQEKTNVLNCIVIDAKSREYYNTVLEPLLNQHPTRRDNEQVKVALEELPQQIARLSEAAQFLEPEEPNANPLLDHQQRIEGARYFETRAEQFKRIEAVLKNEQTWDTKQEDLFKLSEKLRPRWLGR